ncbi:multiheme c-type cytochrome [Pedosphaera parvula]|uniref:5'-nucleotidase/2' 3'-cyclic phosphodiesterase and related esterase-like protein n=1 Tax=Pedosphaera parvula (strain Ellin514) TaxID=320771 RepID=B9X9M5_PEDPL|nr:multiheme c-type cytochrome [Pedosphaera parvula]EEF63269.1 5'-nucleotidase/2' 3'-cyclic phosphodiesterase and related esterase-like protein [Pedosphaera parvula Ellin514]
MKRWLAIIIILIAMGALGGYFAFSKNPKPVPVDLTVLFTADTRGRLVPCGCFTGQYGGLTRLKTVLDNEPVPNGIRVDVGNAIRGKEDYNLIEYKYMLKAYASMNYDVVNLGEREAQLSLAQLQLLKRESPVSLISANLLDDKSGARICEPYKIVQRGKYKVALLGVTDSRIQTGNLGPGVAVEKMEVTLEKLLPELKPKADVIILLAFTDEETLARLAQEFYELDVILGGKVSQPSQKLDHENHSLILYTANEGRALGVLKVRVSGRAKLAGLGHEILLLHDKVPEDESVRALAAQYRNEVRTTRLAIDNPANLQDNMVPGVKAAAEYVGTESCVECHKTAAKAWHDSGHAEAMTALISNHADADPNCIQCHTVGFGSPSGYRREFAAKKMANVGCESCHGPGGLHVAQRQQKLAITFKFRPLAAGDCQKCHYGEFSRPFDWNHFWPQVEHGKEPLRTAGLKKESP